MLFQQLIKMLQSLLNQKVQKVKHSYNKKETRKKQFILLYNITQMEKYMTKNMKKRKTRNRVRKITFQSQSRTNIISIDRGTKYNKQQFLERETENDNIQGITGGCLRPQYI